jgi:hypothetical protein
VFEVSLGRCFTTLLQFVEVVFDLFFIQFCRQAAKMQGHSCYVAAVVVKGSPASSEDGNIALKTFKQLLKSCNFTAGTVEVFVIP